MNLKGLNLVKDKLDVYGQLMGNLKTNKSLNTTTNRWVIPNENRMKTFVTDESMFNIPGSRIRHVLDLYNETIVLNNVTVSSKMYLRSILQYRSCSTLSGCRWKTDTSNLRTNSTQDIFTFSPVWSNNEVYDSGITGIKTYLFSTWISSGVLADPAQNFDVSGKFQIQMADGWHIVNLSWY